MADEMDVVRCFNPECRRAVARMVHDEAGVDFLQAGGLLLREAHGICPQCGQPFHWSVRDVMFEKLIGRLLKVQNQR